MVSALRPGFRLGIDFGTSHTTAMLRWPDGHTRPLLFDGSPLLPSAVYTDADGTLLVGRDAIHAARLDPARFEPTPKRSLQAGHGDVTLVAAVLARVLAEAVRVSSAQVFDVTMTHPAAWDASRIAVLAGAARSAGLPEPRMVPEPVAAAGYYAAILARAIPAGSTLVVYDFGGGTFDASAVTPRGDGYEVLALDGLPDLGGVDIDAALLGHVAGKYRGDDPEAWRRLEDPQSPADRRHRRHLVEDVRAAKEMLSRAASATVPVPLLELEARITREEFETIARPLLDRTVDTTLEVMGRSGGRVAAILLVGGSSRIPLIPELVKRATGLEPSTIDQPETVVAEGSLRLTSGASGETRAGSPLPRPPAQTQLDRTTSPDRVLSRTSVEATGPTVPDGPTVPSGPTAPQWTPPADPWAEAEARARLAAGDLPAVRAHPVPVHPVHPVPMHPVPVHQVPVHPTPVLTLPPPRPPAAPPRPGTTYRRGPRRRWPVVLGTFVAILAVAAATAFALPRILDNGRGKVDPTSSNANPNPNGSTPAPFVRVDPPSWLPAGWVKFLDDGVDPAVVPGAGNEGGRCTYSAPGVLKVSRTLTETQMVGCNATTAVRAVKVTDAAVEAEFAVVNGCGGLWLRTEAAGYFVTVCTGGAVTLHKLGDLLPGDATRIGDAMKPALDLRRVVIGLVARGDTLTVYIDNVAQKSIRDASVTKGRVNVGGFTPQKADSLDVTVTRFRAWQPTGQ